MRKRFAASLLALLVFILAGTTALGEVRYPDPQGYVNDFANILQDAFKRDLETKLSDYERQTTNEIAVVTVSSLEGLSIEDYTIRLAEQWKVGKKDKDNGLILLVAPNERKVRIEVGYGLEPIITDGKAGRIIQEMTPYFKQNNYAGGIKLGVERIIENIGYLTPEEREAQNRAEEERSAATGAGIVMAILFVAAILASIVLIIVVARLISSAMKARAKLNAFRQEVSQNIPVLTREKNMRLWEITRARDRLLKTYLEHHHPLIMALVKTAEDRAKTCQAYLDEADKMRVKAPDMALASLEVAKNAIGDMEKAKKELINFEGLSAEISRITSVINGHLNELSIEGAEKELALLRKEAPREIWASLEGDLAKARDLQDKLRQTLAEIENLNSEKIQKFQEAGKKLPAANDLLNELAAIIAAPREKRLEFEGARSKAGSLKTEIEKKLRKAESKSGDSDAGHRPKDLLAQARAKLEEAETQERGNPTNWILVAMLLGAAISLADKSYREAEDAIDAASRRRRRSYDDSDRRRRDSEDNNVWVSPGIGLGGGGGDGGTDFGGGSFGGGGASGSW